MTEVYQHSCIDSKQVMEESATMDTAALLHSLRPGGSGYGCIQIYFITS
jgi:hypothetical protein